MREDEVYGEFGVTNHDGKSQKKKNVMYHMWTLLVKMHFHFFRDE